MNLNGSQDTYVLKGQKYIESGCHVIDQNEGNLTDQVKITGKVDLRVKRVAIMRLYILFKIKKVSIVLRKESYTCCQMNLKKIVMGYLF